MAFSFAPENCGFDIFSLKRGNVTLTEKIFTEFTSEDTSLPLSLSPFSSSSQVVLNSLLVKQLHFFFLCPHVVALSEGEACSRGSSPGRAGQLPPEVLPQHLPSLSDLLTSSHQAWHQAMTATTEPGMFLEPCECRPTTQYPLPLQWHKVHAL